MTPARDTARRSALAAATWPALLCLLPAVTSSPQHYQWATVGLVWGLWTLSLNIVWGYAGQLSLGQLALGGIAAYGFTMLMSEASFPLGLAVLGGLALAAVAGLALSGAALRLRGFYFAILSLTFASVVTTVITNWDAAGRTAGLLVSRSLLPEIDVLGVHWDLSSRDGGFFALVACVFLVVNALAVWLAYSPAGRAMFAIRDDEPLARSLGIDAVHVKSLAVLLSALVAGVAGVIQSFSYQLVVPELFSLHEMLIALLLVVVGGLGSTSAPAIGAVVYVALYQAAPIDGAWRPAMLGVLVVGIILFCPRGIAGAHDQLAHRLLRGRRPAAPAGSAEVVATDG